MCSPVIEPFISHSAIFFPTQPVSVTGKRGAGIPVILLHDATGGIISVELKNGCVYKGTLEDVQDNMNCMVKVSFPWYP